MKLKLKITKNKWIVLMLIITSCSGSKNISESHSKLPNDEVLKTILEYSKHYKEYINKYDAFFIDNRSIENEDFFQTSIQPLINKYELKEQNGKYNFTLQRYPTNYFEFKNNLYLWYDEKSIINKELIDIMIKYDLIDFNNEFETIFDDKLESVNYVFCKKDLKKFKKIKATVYIPSGSNKLPKLNCN